MAEEPRDLTGAIGRLDGALASPGRGAPPGPTLGQLRRRGRAAAALSKRLAATPLPLAGRRWQAERTLAAALRKRRRALQRRAFGLRARLGWLWFLRAAPWMLAIAAGAALAWAAVRFGPEGVEWLQRVLDPGTPSATPGSNPPPPPQPGGMP